jgi:hypothetical protein
MVTPAFYRGKKTMAFDNTDYISMFWSAQEVGIESMTLYLSVISGYLLVAYFVGSNLTRSQAAFISSIFTVFASYALWGVAQYWWIGDMAREVLESRGLNDIELNYIGLNPALIGAPIGVLGIYGALRFMWHVRHPGSQ